MKLTAMASMRAGALATMLCSLLVSACGTQGVRLSDADRASLNGQPKIHVLHYETPLPDIKTGGKNPPPAAANIRKHAAADPAALIAQSFGRCLARRKSSTTCKSNRATCRCRSRKTQVFTGSNTGATW